ncbi:MAG: hypothetical protein U0Q12_25225 [Vicinamibacterales bacterium]
MVPVPLVPCLLALASFQVASPRPPTSDVPTRPPHEVDAASDDADESASPQSTAWPDDPNATRLIYGPTGRTLERGEAYVELFGINVPVVHVGLTDWLSVGGGTVAFIPDAQPGEIALVAPKVRVFGSARTNVSVGTLHFNAFRRYNGGIAYGVVTQGTSDFGVTMGVGYFYVVEHRRLVGAPALIVGGERRITARVKLISENYVRRDLVLPGGGVRLIRGPLSIDLGLTAVLTESFAMPAPMLRIAWRFREP